MLLDAYLVLRTSFIMCTFAAAKVCIALARRLTIPCKRAIYLQFGSSGRFFLSGFVSMKKQDDT